MTGLQQVVAKFLDERVAVVTAINNCPASNMEDYWRWQGHAQARRVLREDLEREGIDLDAAADDVATVKAEALREAAQAQRQLAADARTNNGQAEHEDRADWLDEQADAIADAPDSDPTKAAIDVIAREVTEQMLDPLDLGNLWSDYPEIGEGDWRDVTARVRARAESAKPDAETYKIAYAHLQGRAEAWTAENDPA